MTGRYSTRTGVWHTIMGRSLLAHDEVTLGDLFAAAGYRTCMIGKWHLGDNYPMRPEDHGFQEVLRIGGGGIGQTPDYWGNDYFDDVYFHNGRPKQFHGYCTDVFFGHAIRFIRENRNRPFFLYLALNAAHAPYRIADTYRQFYESRGVPEPMASFYGMIENIDENLGRLMAVLDDLGLTKNTILIFLTDNGTAAGVARRPGSGWRGFNAGMRGYKGSQYDGGHRVPCFIRWPGGGIGGGKDVDRLTAHFDLFPTLAELCGLKIPVRVQLDGKSLVPLLRNPKAPWPDRTLFVHVQRQEIPPKWVRSAVMTQRWRLVNGTELYDMTKDPGQQHNVAAEYPEVVRQLRAAYEKWWATLTPVFHRYVRIVVGSDHENPSCLNAMDWHAPGGQIPWAQVMIRRAPWANGFWMIEVAKSGTYQITLRQYPPEAEVQMESENQALKVAGKLRANGQEVWTPIFGKPASKPKYVIQGDWAKLQIGDLVAEGPIPVGSSAVTFTMDLPAGPAKLQTWFIDKKSGRSRGAFFVQFRRLNGKKQ